MKNKAIFAISLGFLLFWASLFLSYRNLPCDVECDAQDFQNPIAIGGFPFSIFEYPAPSLGNNFPTPENWFVSFVANILFWLVIGYVVTPIFEKRIENKRWFYSMVSIATFVSIAGVIYLFFLFD